MADDRPLESAEQAIGRIDSKIADLEATLLARLTRRPTGDIEPTVRSTPKPDTLLLNGQQVSRTTYAGLWAWAQAAGLVVAGLFTTGNGTTTFGLPDMRGRVPVGAGTLGSDTYNLGATGGASTRAIEIANLPPHDHNVSGSTGSDSHSHTASTNTTGSHGGHWDGGRQNVGYQADPGAQAYINPDADLNGSGGSHSHSVTVSSDSHSHSLSINESTVGSGTAFDVRQPYIALNWLIYT